MKFLGLVGFSVGFFIQMLVSRIMIWGTGQGSETYAITGAIFWVGIMLWWRIDRLEEALREGLKNGRE